MSRFPFRFEPIGVEYLWQVLILGVVGLLGLRLVTAGRRGAGQPPVDWLLPAATLGFVVAAILAYLIDRAWPQGWRILFVLIIGGAVYALSVLTYRHASRPISRRDRTLLMGLRTVALVAAVLALLHPVFARRLETRKKPYLFLLYDTSRSMAIRDGRDGASRLEDLVAVRAEHGRRLARLERQFEIASYRMDADLGPIEALPGEPQGPATAIGPALRHVAERSEERRVAAVVLLSDGAHNTGIDPDRVAPVLRDRQVPILAVGFGRDVAAGQIRDVAVKTIRCNPTVFTKNVFPVQGDLALLGCAGETVRLQLIFDDQVVDEKDVRATSDSDSPRPTLSFVPYLAGIHKVTIRALPLANELVADNNEASAYVNVLAGGLALLYVEGKARWEYKFLRRTLEASPDFQVTPVLILAPLAAGQDSRLPAGVFEWTRYDVVILGDVGPQVFTQAQLQDLKAGVGDRGKGLMMIGGYDSFGPGNWGRTPLADVLPVRMEPTDAQAKGLYRLSPTPLARRHFVLQIEEDEAASRAAWDRLPPLEGASEFAGVKPGAEVLATGQADRPLLVAQEYGKGRSIALGADSTWRWAFSEADTQKYHKRFWRQVVLWLARRDKEEGQEMWLTLSRQRLKLGEDLEITAHVQDKLGRPVGGATVRATIEGPAPSAVEGPAGLRAPVAFAPGKEAHTLTHRPPARGDYTIRATATRDGETLGSAEAKFIVYVPDLEFERPVADLARLKSLASQTQGRYFAPEEAGALFDLLDERRVPDTIVVHTDVIPLWNSWHVLVIFLGALAAEWVLRKRKGMV